MGSPRAGRYSLREQGAEGEEKAKAQVQLGSATQRLVQARAVGVLPNEFRDFEPLG
jgi:hypothetical protein